MIASLSQCYQCWVDMVYYTVHGTRKTAGVQDPPKIVHYTA
jgi:hypothetical protein